MRTATKKAGTKEARGVPSVYFWNLSADSSAALVSRMRDLVTRLMEDSEHGEAVLEDAAARRPPLQEGSEMERGQRRFAPDIVRPSTALKRNVTLRAAAVKVLFAAATGVVMVFMGTTASTGRVRGGMQAAELSLSAAQQSTVLAALPADVKQCINPAVDPCDDFYSYACGGWVEKTTIPADKPLIARSFDGAANEVHEKLKNIYETAYPPASPFRALSHFYQSCMNTTLLDQLGAAPLKPMLDRIDRAASTEEVYMYAYMYIHACMYLQRLCPERLRVLTHGVYVCMCVCMCGCGCVYTHVHNIYMSYLYVNIYTYTYIYYIYIYYVYIYVYTYIYMYIYIYYIYIYHIYIYHIYIYTYIYRWVTFSQTSSPARYRAPSNCL
jgi:hypothetical protein